LAYERANNLADKAISDQGRQRVVPTDKSSSLHVRKPCREAGKVTYQDCHSTFNISVRDAIRNGAAENEVQKHE